jgi:putative MATE family efflux protein
VLSLGFPMLLGAMSSSMAGIVDTAMMGRYGSRELAVVGGTSAVFDLFASTVLASMVGHQILTARFAGRDDPAGIRRSCRDSAVFCSVIASALTAVCLLAGAPLTELVCGDHRDLTRLGVQYLTARGPTLLLLVPFSLLAAIFNGYRQPRQPAAAGIMINLVNLLLDWLLIYGPGPFPRLGVVGNGLATTLAWTMGVCWLLAAAIRHRLSERLSQPGSATTPVDFVTRIPKLAWPAIVSSVLDYAGMAVFFGILGSLAESALAGGRVAYEIMVLLFGTGTAFAAATRILVGRAVGGGNIDDSVQFWRAGRQALLAPAVVLAVVMVALPRACAMLFTSAPAVVDRAALAIPLIGFCTPLMAWTLSNTSVLRAIGKTRADMSANLVSALAVQLPVAVLLTKVTHQGVRGAFLGVLAYWLVRAVLTDLLARSALRLPIPSSR